MTTRSRCACAMSRCMVACGPARPAPMMHQEPCGHVPSCHGRGIPHEHRRARAARTR
ncbi:hypothetical protein FM110_02335 [Brachybacterium nesterenkovii]|uniref:Uncharacterized protein n=1 Tax=Brachybacterium nesterenkovii TaxID=47847 RepID=A0A1X6WWA8_9MICO|nr:hypothetical protein FM110_02335 [Brachybacterium nesterenkovii]